MTDDRNYEVTNAVYDTLNRTKGFDVGMSNPSKGRIIVRHNNTDYLLEVSPIYNDSEKGKQPFSDIMRENSFMFN